MRALVLDGSIGEDAYLAAGRKAVLDHLHASGWSYQTLRLSEMKIAYCAGCFKCWVNTPGTCVVDDAAARIIHDALRSDLLICLTPVTFGGYSSELKKALDRMIPILSPFFTDLNGETHHRKRYDKYPSFFVIGSLPRHDDESQVLFADLVRRNAVNLNAPVYAASFVTSASTANLMATLKRVLEKVEA